MIRLALRVRREHAEVVLAELLALAPAGIEEVELPGRAGGDESSEPEGGEGLIEYAVYGAPGELPELPDLQAAAGGALVEVSTTEIPDDWSERWKRFHRPVLISPPDASSREDADTLAREGGAGVRAQGAPCARVRVSSLHVRPPWEAALDREGAHEIVIDPAQAFGTGAHATTRLCLELLLALATLDPARGAVLDVGAGSGVLAIAAAKLGYGPILALDNDRESVAAILENATANGVRIEARRFELRAEPLPSGDGGGRPLGEPIVLANLLRPLLLDLSGTIEHPPAHLIASGLLRDQADEVSRAFSARLNLRERERREQGEWAALWLTRS